MEQWFMLLLGALLVLSTLVVSVIAIRRAPVTAPTGALGHWLHRLAIGLLGLYALFFLTMGFGEISAGIAGGEGHLFPAASAAILAVLARQRPDTAGTILLVLGAVMGVFFMWMFDVFGWPGQWQHVPIALLIGAGPFLLPGLLLKIAGRQRPGGDEATA